jgi:hypothetical protein
MPLACMASGGGLIGEEIATFPGARPVRPNPNGAAKARFWSVNFLNKNMAEAQSLSRFTPHACDLPHASHDLAFAAHLLQ